MKSKSANEIYEVMKKFLHNALIINNLTYDKGLEFINKLFNKFCEDNNINKYPVKADSHKLGIINRFHRTLKTKLLKYFTMKNTVNWVDVLDKIINNYNNTQNRGIYDLTPREASKHSAMNYIISTKRDITNSIKKKEQVINVGDYCRIKNNKKILINYKPIILKKFT